MSATAVPPLSRRLGRTIFGEDAAGYDGARADYPDILFDRLAERCGGTLEHRAAFEIGPGTGLATRALLARGLASLTAIEPDVALGGHLAANLHDTRLRVLNAPFEEADLPDGGYDLGFAAASFHWLDAGAALTKIRRLLRPGGQWVMVWNVYRTSTSAHPFVAAAGSLLAALPQPPSERAVGHYSLDTDARKRDLADAGFDDTEHEVVRREHMLSAVGIRSLYGSFSMLRSLPMGKREQLLDRLADIVEREFGGAVSNPVLTACYFGTSAGDRHHNAN